MLFDFAEKKTFALIRDAGEKSGEIAGEKTSQSAGQSTGGRAIEASAYSMPLASRPLAKREPLHFYHANSYPFGCYRQFLQSMQQNCSREIIGLAHRATWPNNETPHNKAHQETAQWADYADDLIAYLEQQHNGQPVIGVGHSMGAVCTMFAAAKRPDLFKAIALIDPVFMPSYQALALRFSPESKRQTLPIVKRALGRPDAWPTISDCAEFHASKRAYSRFSESAMQDFAFGSLVEDLAAEPQRRFRFDYPKRWEAHVYSTVPLVWSALKKISVPVLGVRGADSDVLTPKMWQRWTSRHPSHQLHEMASVGHLAPLEQPEAVARLLTDWLSGL